MKDSTKKLLENQIKRVVISDAIQKRIENYKGKLIELSKTEFQGLCPFCKQPDSPEFCSCLDILQKDELAKVAPPGREAQVKALKPKVGKKSAFKIAWAQANAEKGAHMKGENGVAGGEPPGIDAQTDMMMAEPKSRLEAVSMEKDEDLNDFMAKVHRGKIDGKVPKRIKENPEHAPNNDVLAQKPQSEADINSGGIEGEAEGDFGSQVCNKDELDKAGLKPSSSLGEKVGNLALKQKVSPRKDSSGWGGVSAPEQKAFDKTHLGREQRHQANMNKAHPIVEGAKVGAMEGAHKAHSLHAGDPQKVVAGALVGGVIGGAKSVFHHLKSKAGVNKAMSGSGALSGGMSAAPMTLGMGEDVEKAGLGPSTTSREKYDNWQKKPGNATKVQNFMDKNPGGWGGRSRFWSAKCWY